MSRARPSDAMTKPEKYLRVPGFPPIPVYKKLPKGIKLLRRLAPNSLACISCPRIDHIGTAWTVVILGDDSAKQHRNRRLFHMCPTCSEDFVNYTKRVRRLRLARRFHIPAKGNQ